MTKPIDVDRANAHLTDIRTLIEDPLPQIAGNNANPRILHRVRVLLGLQARGRVSHRRGPNRLENLVRGGMRNLSNQGIRGEQLATLNRIASVVFEENYPQFFIEL